MGHVERENETFSKHFLSQKLKTLVIFNIFLSLEMVIIHIFLN